jgi:hypothetical protein
MAASISSTCCANGSPAKNFSNLKKTIAGFGWRLTFSPTFAVANSTGKRWV